MAEERSGNHAKALEALQKISPSSASFLDNPYSEDSAVARVLLAEAKSVVKP